ncbi:MAG: hypothetical protein B7733_16350 [Myxococcales bacterium FL481]|nr:MAG: hypothetical protein B7733_16350 [Myxococcales bacterium FL481]
MLVSRARASALAWMALAGVSSACDNRGRDQLDVDFDIPRSEDFPALLSAYGLFEGPMGHLVPSATAVEYELASPLFTDYSHKQRLLKLPEGTTMEVFDSFTARFPEGTVVAKTFYYPFDFADESRGREIIETRLLVRRQGDWNVATYIWNEAQTDAALALDGARTHVDWRTASGAERSTHYEIPSEVACVTCHQRDEAVTLIGLTPRNMNTVVVRDGVEIDQLEYLQSRAVLSGLGLEGLTSLPAYTNHSNELAIRARSYLDANCAHCHSPRAWKRAAREDLDLRYETALPDTGIVDEPRALRAALTSGDMPYVGTTLIDDEGVSLVVDYLDTVASRGRGRAW